MSETAASVDQQEIENFSALAAEWWDESGPFKPLHAYNPVRVSFVRDRICATENRDPQTPRPLEGLKIADIGCGGGLLCEPLSRLGANVTGIDPAEKNIAAASLHAEQMGLEIDYRQTTIEDIAASGEQFDAIVSMEVLEHVADINSFVGACSQALKPGGAFVGATLNRTLRSLAMAKVGAEYILRWLPIGTHDWKKFLTPAEVTRALRETGLTIEVIQGATYQPLSGQWALTSDTGVNYMFSAHKGA